MGSTGGKGRTGLDLPESEGQRRDADRDGMPSPRPPARPPAMSQSSASRRHTETSCSGEKVLSRATRLCRRLRGLSRLAREEGGETGNCVAPGIPHHEIRGACVR